MNGLAWGRLLLIVSGRRMGPEGNPFQILMRPCTFLICPDVLPYNGRMMRSVRYG
jgi:hypothetical protein